MKLLVENKGRTFDVASIGDLTKFAAPEMGSLFPCLIWDHLGGSTCEEPNAVAEALLDAGCRNLVCGGLDCQAWEYAIDNAFVDRHMDAPDDMKEAVFVMSSSHAEESVDDVAFHFVYCTSFDHHDFDRFLVLHVGDGAARQELDLAVREWALELRKA